MAKLLFPSLISDRFSLTSVQKQKYKLRVFCVTLSCVGLGVYQLCKWSEYEIKLENDAEVISTKISQLYRLTLTHFMEQINAMMEGKSILSTEIKQQSKSRDV